jgi:hypothetical protein
MTIKTFQLFWWVMFPHCGRTLASSPGERRRSGHLLVAGERISLSGDLRAMVWLRGACLEHLRSLPTTLAEDQGLLDACVAAEAARKKEDPNSHFECLGNNNILALQWRMCQKRFVCCYRIKWRDSDQNSLLVCQPVT